MQDRRLCLAFVAQPLRTSPHRPALRRTSRTRTVSWYPPECALSRLQPGQAGAAAAASARARRRRTLRRRRCRRTSAQSTTDSRPSPAAPCNRGSGVSVRIDGSPQFGQCSEEASGIAFRIAVPSSVSNSLLSRHEPAKPAKPQHRTNWRPMTLLFTLATPSDVEAVVSLRGAVARDLTQRYGRGHWSSVGTEKSVLARHQDLARDARLGRAAARRHGPPGGQAARAIDPEYFTPAVRRST